VTPIAADAIAPSTLLARLHALRDELAVLEPERYEGDACAEIAEALATLAKSCDVAAMRAARRAAECGQHRARGFADQHDWVAAVAGTTPTAAREALRTVADADDCPDTRDAMRAGEVSMAQATEIVRTEREAPGSEHQLLEVAKARSLGAVREQARSRRLASVDPEHLRRRQHEARAVRHWRDPMGMVCGSFRLTPVAGTSFAQRLDRETNRLWRAAKRAGRDAARESLAADAFVGLLAGTSDMAAPPGATAAPDAPMPADGTATTGKARTGKRPRRRRLVNADVVIVQSAEAARRGRVLPGEVCHVVGGGPIAPSEVEELIAAGAFVKALLHDGKRVTHVAHYGRNLTAEMRTALGVGPPPTFDGLRCSDDGCERRLGLEIDHVDPVANGGATSLENLDPKCWVHHQAKTERDRASGLLRSGP
jgi:hypothetical protein